MTMTDPIADMLTRLRNANQAYQESTSMPSSKIKVGIAEILKAEGYISNFELTEVEGQVGKVLKSPSNTVTPASAPSQGSVASASPACASTRRPTPSRRCSAVSVSPSSPPPRGC